MSFAPVPAIIAAVLLATFAKSIRQDGQDRISRRLIQDRMDGAPTTICIISANAVETDNLHYLMQACINAENTTNVIALALQDYRGGKFPQYTKKFDRMKERKRFKLRHQLLLSNGTGTGAFCGSFYNNRFLTSARKFWLNTGLGRNVDKMAADKGVNCGGVAIAIYSLKNTSVIFELNDQDVFDVLHTDKTSTTRKGSVVIRIGVNNRQIVIASTHGTEGIRAKKRGTQCPGGATNSEYKKEEMRVQVFEKTLVMINKIRHSIEAQNGAGVLWGGDFNPRSVETTGPHVGCPIFPEVPIGPEGDIEADKALKHLMKSRDVLGSKLGSNNTRTLATFTNLLQGQDIFEAEGLTCPTYKKYKQLLPPESQFQFRCKEGPDWHFYKTSHPPSWTDRIFHSNQKWLNCDRMYRVKKNEDHDAVVMACKVQAP